MAWSPGADLSGLWGTLESAAAATARALGAGPAHRRRLDGVDTRVVVSGTRGKSTAVRWLHDVFHRRGYDTFAKVTGDEPRTVHNGETTEITRPAQVRLYENERVLAAAGDPDVAIFENQGIREYTTRLVNDQFVRPHVVFLTNVREDHLDTLGRTRAGIARSFARAVPAGTTVVSGEPDETLRRYLETELRERDADIVNVDVPAAARSVPGAEVVYGVDAVLEALGEPPLPPEDVDARLAELTVSWRQLPGGRVFDAAHVNDVQSTDLVRRALAGGDEVVEPLVFLRADRRGRTASFVRYLDRLSDRGLVERVHLIGDDQALFARNASVPVVRHDTGAEPPDKVLDDALSAGRPVVVMGNSVDEYMHELERVIVGRAVQSLFAPASHGPDLEDEA